MKAQLGIDYVSLRDYLAEGRVREAEDETRAKLIEMAGEEAKKRKWVYFTEAKAIPQEDLRTVDRLWRHFTGNRQGYSVQRRIWNNCKGLWTSFFRKISWVYGENDNYRKWYPDENSEFIYNLDEAPNGHLPLTNCLRGTQLLESILSHPAIVAEEEDLRQQTSLRPSVSAPSSSSSEDESEGKRATNIPGLSGI